VERRSIAAQCLSAHAGRDVATPDEAGERFPQSLGEPLFDCRCRLVWQVTEARHRAAEVRSSASLWDSTLPHSTMSLGVKRAGARPGYVQGPEEADAALVERTIRCSDEGDSWWRLPATAVEIDDENAWLRPVAGHNVCRHRYYVPADHDLSGPLRACAAKRISAGLASIRSVPLSGSRAASDRGRGARARHQRADRGQSRDCHARAHAPSATLPCAEAPLSVMMNEASANLRTPWLEDPRARLTSCAIRSPITLRGAGWPARVAVVGTSQRLRPVVSALVRMMEKIHHDRGISIMLDATGTRGFRGRSRTLRRCRHLVDNAANGRSRACAGTFVERPRSIASGASTHRCGRRWSRPVPAAARAGRPARRRLDEAKPGTGLGLSIVVELVNLYGGDLTLGRPDRRAARRVGAARCLSVFVLERARA